VRKIRELLYEQGYTIQGARQQLENKSANTASSETFELLMDNAPELEDNSELDEEVLDLSDDLPDEVASADVPRPSEQMPMVALNGLQVLIDDLRVVRDLLQYP
jgi:hypothetical protein